MASTVDINGRISARRQNYNPVDWRRHYFTDQSYVPKRRRPVTYFNFNWDQTLTSHSDSANPYNGVGGNLTLPWLIDVIVECGARFHFQLPWRSPEHYQRKSASD